MNYEGMKESGYGLCTNSMLDYFDILWETQGKTSQCCTGMSSFSFYPEHVTFWAAGDCVIYSHLWDRRADLSLDETAVCYRSLYNNV